MVGLCRPVKGNWDGRDNNSNANKEIIEGVLHASDAWQFVQFSCISSAVRPAERSHRTYTCQAD